MSESRRGTRQPEEKIGTTGEAYESQSRVTTLLEQGYTISGRRTQNFQKLVNQIHTFIHAKNNRKDIRTNDVLNAIITSILSPVDKQKYPRRHAIEIQTGADALYAVTNGASPNPDNYDNDEALQTAIQNWDIPDTIKTTSE